MSAAAPDPAVIVSVAVALPLESKVTEFELSEQLGEPACAGCTEQASETGLSNAFSSMSVIVDVELCPRLTELGLAAEAEIEKSVETVFSSTIGRLVAVEIGGSRQPDCIGRREAYRRLKSSVTVTGKD